MNIKLEFVYKDVPYTLEYDRNSIIQMEQAGLDLADFLKKPISCVDIAFKGAFLKNHRATKEKLIEEIYGNMTDKEALINRLVEMINETYESLLDNPEDDSEGKIKWDVVGSKKN